MKLIFLDRITLKYKDNAYVSSELEIVLDSVVKQKSNFTVNKEAIKASVGDIVVLKEGKLSYIGIVQAITLNDDKTSKVQLNDFKEIFNIKVPVSSFTGNVCKFLADTIKKAFVSNSDSKQNLKYLTVTTNSDIEGSFNYGADTLMNIEDLMETITKTYGVVIKYQVNFIRGRFSNIEIIIEEEETHIVKLRHDLKAISNLKIKESEENVVNKCIFYPKEENEEHKKEVEYYLLTDGSITTNKDDDRRFPYVNVESEFYSDSDFEKLESKAKEKLIKSSNDHQITFDLDVTNNVFVPLGNIFIGYFVEFYAPKRTYTTMLTQIKYKNTFASCTLTLGEQRTSLTDKIKMMNGGTSNNKSVVNVSTAITNFDGGIY